MDDYRVIIQDYLQPFPQITREMIDCLRANCVWKSPSEEGMDCKHYKIVNNKLYEVGPRRFPGWESRREGFNSLVLALLKKYTIPDCEFILYNDDGVNESNIKLCRGLPLIVSTSVLDCFSMILCPDWTFSCSTEYCVKSHESYCEPTIALQDTLLWKDKKEQLVWRGSGNTGYRASYMKDNNLYDCKSILNAGPVERHEKAKIFTLPNTLTREERSRYKYSLQLNGHEGNSHNGAYATSFKWSLMSHMVPFYSAPVKYREFWMHPQIFHEEEHYLFTETPEELEKVYERIRKNPDVAERIADSSFTFFKKYLRSYDMIIEYMYELLTNYAKRQTFQVTIAATDQLIESRMANEFLDS